MCYLNGYGTKIEIKEAFRQFETARHNNSDCQYMLGKLYEEGKGIRQDIQFAKKYYAKAVQKGNKNAKIALRRIEEEEKAKMEQRNKAIEGRKIAIQEKRKVEQRPNAYNRALYVSSCRNPKDLYEKIIARPDIYSRNNREEAFRNLKTRCREINEPLFYEAECYINGFANQFYVKGDKRFKEMHDVDKYDLAVKLWKKAAKNNYTPAILKLGNTYATGKGGLKNSKLAYNYYMQALKGYNDIIATFDEFPNKKFLEKYKDVIAEKVDKAKRGKVSEWDSVVKLAIDEKAFKHAVELVKEAEKNGYKNGDKQIEKVNKAYKAFTSSVDVKEAGNYLKSQLASLREEDEKSYIAVLRELAEYGDIDSRVEFSEILIGSNNSLAKNYIDSLVKIKHPKAHELQKKLAVSIKEAKEKARLVDIERQKQEAIAKKEEATRQKQLKEDKDRKEAIKGICILVGVIVFVLGIVGVILGLTGKVAVYTSTGDIFITGITITLAIMSVCLQQHIPTAVFISLISISIILAFIVIINAYRSNGSVMKIIIVLPAKILCIVLLLICALATIGFAQMAADSQKKQSKAQSGVDKGLLHLQTDADKVKAEKYKNLAGAGASAAGFYFVRNLMIKLIKPVAADE